MLRRSLSRRTSALDQIKENRRRTAQQFATLTGWQRGDDPEFDSYVAEKRKEKEFDAFDQRVERAYQRMAKLHKAEVWNAYKRDLRETGKKLNPTLLAEINSAADDRAEWLRDVFAQIDADYRSGDAERQKQAAKDISQALQGDPGDYMQWLYERKREVRFLGEKGKAEAQAQDEGDSLPDVRPDEVNRYSALKLKMSQIRDLVEEQYGSAGLAHWDKLQLAKDQEYREKLELAAENYKLLLKQQDQYDAGVSNERQRLVAERMSTAQAKFKAAMELEDERERLIANHKERTKERFEKARADRIEKLKLATKLREQGKTTEEVADLFKMKKLDELIQTHNEEVRREQHQVVAKRRKFLDMIQQMRTKVEEREGKELLQMEYPGGGEMDAESKQNLVRQSKAEADDQLMQKASDVAKLRGDESPASRKKALWDVLNDDKWYDPFITVHQARLHARNTYDPIYMRMDPTKLAQEKHEWDRGHGQWAIGGGTERSMLQMPEKVLQPYQWGVSAHLIQNMDPDGKTVWASGAQDTRPHIMDPKTMDIDLRFERKDGGGPIWTGPRFYPQGKLPGEDIPVQPS